jgi:hypothetical protein
MNHITIHTDLDQKSILHGLAESSFINIVEYSVYSELPSPLIDIIMRYYDASDFVQEFINQTPSINTLLWYDQYLPLGPGGWDEIFVAYCYFGDLDCIKHILNTRCHENLRSYYCYHAFNKCWNNERFNILDYLIDEAKLAKDMWGKSDEFTIMLCSRANLDTIKYYDKKFRLSKEDYCMVNMNTRNLVNIPGAVEWVRNRKGYNDDIRRDRIILIGTILISILLLSSIPIILLATSHA